MEADCTTRPERSEGGVTMPKLRMKDAEMDQSGFAGVKFAVVLKPRKEAMLDLGKLTWKAAKDSFGCQDLCVCENFRGSCC